jgi:hypothetical protein
MILGDDATSQVRMTVTITSPMRDGQRGIRRGTGNIGHVTPGQASFALS